jgi:ribonuclease HII
VLDHERQAWSAGHQRVAGVDEAGRGPLAGPVVAAAVFIPRRFLVDEGAAAFPGLNDSKQVPPARREALYGLLTTHPEVLWAVGEATVAEIDRHNILRATHLAMARAVSGLSESPDHILVDGLPVQGLPCGSRAIVKGDASSMLIAAASVVAKVHRDRLMGLLDTRYPGYGLARHKGYGTRAHLEALARLGPSPCHRRSFAPVGQMTLDLGT